MKKLTVFLSILLLLSCQKDDEPEQTTPPTHIAYFGFTLIDTYWDDPTDNQEKTNYLDEVQGFSNIADILVVNPTDNIVDRMTAMNDVEVKSLLHISELFFEWVGDDSPSGARYALRADHQSRWDAFVSTNDLQTNQGLIQALYIGEEPTWNGISFLELKTATDYVKASLPAVPTMVIEAYPILDQLQIPSSVDWVGFDHYFVKDPLNNSEFINELNTLKSKLSTNEQQLVMVMDTHYISELHGTYGGIAIDEMEAVANSYYELAKQQPKTVALLGYFWPSGFDLPNAIGARHMPQAVKDNYMRIGKEITHKE